MDRNYVDRSISSIARRQYGTFSHAQAIGCGATPDSIKHRLESGLWVRIDTAVYAFPSNPFTWERQCMAAVLTHGQAVLRGRSAAVIHGFPGFRPSRPEITVPRGADHRCRLAVVRQSDLVEWTRVRGFPVTTVAQTVIEVARYLRVDALGDLVDDLVQRRRDHLGALQDRYVELAHTRWPGIARVRRVLHKRDEAGWVPPESKLESVLWRVLGRVPGLPTCVRQAAIPWPHGGSGRVDVLIPAWRTIVEADGRRWHTRVRDFERDRERDNAAVVHGYRVLRFTWFQLTRRHREVVATLLQLGDLVRSGDGKSSAPLVA